MSQAGVDHQAVALVHLICTCPALRSPATLPAPFFASRAYESVRTQVTVLLHSETHRPDHQVMADQLFLLMILRCTASRLY
jgi:hypothetical protein